LARAFNSKDFLQSWKKSKEKREREEWLFAIAVVKAGLQREGNLDEAAEKEIASALEEFDVSPEELEEYLQKNRRKLLRFLDSHPA
jgi:hypothetical protein